MKKLNLLSLVGVILIAVFGPEWAAARGGGGGGGSFHGGGFGGGHFGGGSIHSSGFGGGGAARTSPGGRFSFGARPVYGRPAFARSPGRAVNLSVRPTTASGRQGNRSASAGTRGPQTSRSPVARPTDRRPAIAGTHIFARHDNNWHRDWDHRGPHFAHGHWWCFDGDAWIGLDAGFYPWDYYPYYAFDYYPYDYYPGYYGEVEQEYYDAGVSASVDQTPDPNVTAVQSDLTKLGYFHGEIDGLFGRQTRDAVARYQTDQQLPVTGTLTTETLQSLGVQKVASN
jgi:hypothetical protein